MARQQGLIKFTGQIGGISFYKTKADGYLARTKTSHSWERIMHDPRFARVRENSSEFGRASHAGKVLRKVIHHLTDGVADKKMYTRMTKAMVEVVREDTLHDRGMRTVVDEHLTMLRGFEFNEHMKFGEVLRGDYDVVMDAMAGTVAFRMKGMLPCEGIAAPKGATHARVVLGLAAVDFGDETSEVKEAYGSFIDLRGEQEIDVEVVQELPGKDAPVVVLIGVRFFQEVNGAMNDVGRNVMVVAGVKGGRGEFSGELWMVEGTNANIEYRTRNIEYRSECSVLRVFGRAMDG